MKKHVNITGFLALFMALGLSFSANTHTSDYDVEKTEEVDYNLRAGVSYGLNKTFSLAFDPEKQKFRLEMGFLQLKKMKNLRIRTRLSLRKAYVKAVYKW